MDEKVNELTELIKTLPEKTLDKLIEKYRKSQEIFLLDYRILGYNRNKLFILEYKDEKYVKVQTQDLKTPIGGFGIPQLLNNGKIQFLSKINDKLWRWTYDGKEFESQDTSIPLTYMSEFLLAKDGSIFISDGHNVSKYSINNKLKTQVKWEFLNAPDFVYELSTDKIFFIGEYVEENGIYDKKTLKYLGKMDIYGEKFGQINSDTFILDKEVIRYSPNSFKGYEVLFKLPDYTLAITENYSVSSDGEIYKLNLEKTVKGYPKGVKKYPEGIGYTKIQKLKIEEANSVGPYVFNDFINIYKLKKKGNNLQFSKVAGMEERDVLIGPFPIIRYDKLKASKYIDFLGVSTDLLLIIIDYIVPEIL